MMHYYLDSSALVKRYVREAGTDWILERCDPDSSHTIYTVRISGAEIVAAFFRRVRTRTLGTARARAATTQFKADFGTEYQIVEASSQVVELAMDLAERHGLRGYDSVQLAAALLLHDVRESVSLSPIHFVCADNKLNDIAAIEGLPVKNPNDYV